MRADSVPEGEWNISYVPRGRDESARTCTLVGRGYRTLSDAQALCDEFNTAGFIDSTDYRPISRWTGELALAGVPS